MPNLYEASPEYAASLLPHNQAKWQEIITKTRDHIAERVTTPAGLNMLYTLHSCFEANGFQPINRQTIGNALGRRSGLTVWDRKLLKLLEEKKLITCERVTLPGRKELGMHLPRGYEYRYSMSVKLGYRLYVIKRQQAA
jgi:hypothetical protein